MPAHAPLTAHPVTPDWGVKQTNEISEMERLFCGRQSSDTAGAWPAQQVVEADCSHRCDDDQNAGEQFAALKRRAQPASPRRFDFTPQPFASGRKISVAAGTRPSLERLSAIERFLGRKAKMTADHFQRFAAECRAMANGTRNPRDKEVWVGLAERWLRCATLMQQDEEGVRARRKKGRETLQ